MNKREVLRTISEKTGVTMAQVNNVLIELGNIVVNSPANSTVIIPWGKFQIRYEKPRVANVRGEKYLIPERVTIRLRSKYFRITPDSYQWDVVTSDLKRKTATDEQSPQT